MKTISLIIATLMVSTTAFADISSGQLHCQLFQNEGARSENKTPLTMQADGTAFPQQVQVQLGDISCKAEGRLGANGGGVEVLTIVLPSGAELTTQTSHRDSSQTVLLDYIQDDVRTFCVCSVRRNAI